MYLTPKEVQKRYGFHPRTLVDWANEGKIECLKSPGGHRRYAVSSLEKVKTGNVTTVLYARVSTTSQKDDLKTQVDYLASRYPGNECITDLGSLVVILLGLIGQSAVILNRIDISERDRN